MQRELVGITVIGALLWLVSTHSSPAPQLKGAIPAKERESDWHLIRGKSQIDAEVDVTLRTPDDQYVTGKLLQYKGNLYVRGDSDIQLGVTRHIYAIEPGLDIGAVGGYRGSFRGTAGDAFTVGLRASPVRLFNGLLAPDAVIAKDWVGAGVSVYAPAGVLSPTWRHIGVGLWYGIPTGGVDYGPPGWTVGLSFSTR